MDPTQSEQLAANWTAAQRTVGAFVASLVPNFHQVEEILQRVALVLVRKFHEYDHRQPFVAWALKVARYEVLYYRRQQATDRHRFQDSTLDQIEATHVRLDAEVVPAEQALRECLKQVQGRAREALEFRYRDDLKPAELARRLGLGGGAARMLLSRVREAIRQCVDRKLTRTETLR